MGKSVAFHNLGCKVNSYETEKMMKELAEKGYVIVPFDQKADVYIVNTCSVTNIADRKSRQMIHRARALNPGAVIVAAGCYVNTHEKSSVESEGADICVVNEKKRFIADIIEEYLAGKEALPGDHDSPDCAGAIPGMPLHTRCFIKVQDGCDQFCSYCIIPFARGRIRSRKISEICSEIEGYVRDGYREFVPTGIHISSYGRERPEDGEGLGELLLAISEIEGVERIRLSSLEPRTVTEEFVKTLSGIRQICPHFHLSLQSGSDEVLRRMNRHYTTREYERSVALLREYFKDPAVTTDIIAGFPGESREEFEETIRFVESMDFYETHIFKYSRRRGTAADRMQGQLSEAEKHERAVKLSGINNIKKKRFEDLYISSGRRVEVLFEDTEGTGGKNMLTGYTREYIKVYDDSGAYASGDIAEGTLKRNGDIILLNAY